MFNKCYTVHILAATQLFMADRGEWSGRPGLRKLRSGSMGIKIDILNEKNVPLGLNKFKLLIKVKRNSVNNCELYVKFVISVKGAHCD